MGVARHEDSQSDRPHPYQQQVANINAGRESISWSRRIQRSLLGENINQVETTQNNNTYAKEEDTRYAESPSSHQEKVICAQTQK